MRFHQVRELVRWAADYHARLSSVYAERAVGKVEERVRMALNYLSEHECTMQASLEQYLAEGSEHADVLDTWFDDPFDASHLLMLDQLGEDMPCDSVQSVLDTALTTHSALQGLFRRRAQRAPTASEKEFFEVLVNGLEAEVRRLSRDMQRLESY